MRSADLWYRLISLVKFAITSCTSITSFWCSDFDETLDLPRQCLRGRRRLSPAELSKCYTRAAFQLFNRCSMGSRRELSLAQYCLSCIRQKSVESLLSMGSSYTSMPTTDKFTSPHHQVQFTVHDVAVWMSASRLCLNASKTQVLWLGSRHNIDKLTVHEAPVLSSTVGVVGSASDLGIVTDSRPRGVSLSLSIPSPAAD